MLAKLKTWPEAIGNGFVAEMRQLGLGLDLPSIAQPPITSVKQLDGETRRTFVDYTATSFRAMNEGLRHGEGIGTGGTDLLADWPDATGNGWSPWSLGIAARPLFQPAGLYGRPCVAFDGVDDRLTIVDGFLLPQPFTLVWIGAADANPAIGSRIVSHLPGPNSCQLGLGADGRWFASGGPAHFITGGVVPTIGQTYRIAARFAGVDSALSVNGVQIASGDLGGNPMVNLRLGLRYDSQFPFAGRMRFLGIARGALMSAQLAAIDAFATA